MSTVLAVLCSAGVIASMTVAMVAWIIGVGHLMGRRWRRAAASALVLAASLAFLDMSAEVVFGYHNTQAEECRCTCTRREP